MRAEDNVKQVIVLRDDLNMSPGKAASQAAHASISFLTRRMQALVPGPQWALELTRPERLWLKQSFTKRLFSLWAHGIPSCLILLHGIWKIIL
jgi:peptidyl-tRNA hydrolase